MFRFTWIIRFVLIISLCLFFSFSFFAQELEIPYGKIQIDGKVDEDLDKIMQSFDLTLERIGGDIGPYTTYLSYDEENFYFACKAMDDLVACWDEEGADFKDSDYIRFYVTFDPDFKVISINISTCSKSFFNHCITGYNMPFHFT